MSKQRKLLILHDSAEFGGHERMLMALMPALFTPHAMFDEVMIFLPAVNVRFQSTLAERFPEVRQITSPFVKRRGEPYLRHFRWRYRNAVQQLIALEQPETVLLVQGRIENLAVPLAVLPLDIRVVSYVPMAHRLSEMGRSGMIGDPVRRSLYRRPDHFIVPSEAVAGQIARAGGTAPVSVVHNFVEPPPQADQQAARLILSLPLQRPIALFLGRLDMMSKGIDRLLHAMRCAGPEMLKEWTFLFVGDGPDREMIERFVHDSRMDVHLISWTDRPELYMAASDVMLLPSRWEGVPLVMLEAMTYGLPILASDIDVYRLYLPDANTVNFDAVDLPEALLRVCAPDAIASFARQSSQKLGSHTVMGARQSFARALVEPSAA